MAGIDVPELVECKGVGTGPDGTDYHLFIASLAEHMQRGASGGHGAIHLGAVGAPARLGRAHGVARRLDWRGVGGIGGAVGGSA